MVTAALPPRRPVHWGDIAGDRRRGGHRQVPACPGPLGAGRALRGVRSGRGTVPARRWGGVRCL